MKVIAIIPARGGSKGVPGKNIKQIAGLPLLAHTIKHALNTPSISRVFVSTDDEKIASVAREFDAEVIPRPLEISGDKATSTSALQHVVQYLKQTENFEPELIVFLQATSPYRKADDIENAINKLKSEDADSLLSTSEFHGFLWRDHEGVFGPFNYDYRHRPRRQDAPHDMVENGSIYVLRPWILKDLDNHLGGKITYYEQGLFESFQIDVPEDFFLLETLMLRLDQQKSMPDFSKTKMVVFDFDGVMTDNKVMVDQEGHEFVLCDRSDGWGIGKLRKTSIKAMILSTEKNPVVSARAKKLNIDCYQDCENKLDLLKEIAIQNNISKEEIVYVGNDENDLECMKWVGIPVAVADSAESIRPVAKYMTKNNGGNGAVREVCDLLTNSISNEKTDQDNK